MTYEEYIQPYIEKRTRFQQLSQRTRLVGLELDIVIHRLTETDCIVEALSGSEMPVATGNDGEYYHEQDIETCCGFLNNDDVQGALDFSVAITYDVLKECIEGSTWLASCEDQAMSIYSCNPLSRMATQNEWYKERDRKVNAFVAENELAIRSAAQKIAEFTGIRVSEISIPNG